MASVEGRLSFRDLLKRLLVGRALSSRAAEHQLLPKSLALPVFASDQLSSVAYATEEMMLVLVLVGAAGLAYTVPLGVGVAILLVIVIVSYRQTVHQYPRGGGSYIVARENLGTLPGLTAAAAILTSYVLTVSVSVTAGAIAVTSAFPDLAEQKVLLAIAFVALIGVANLRGAKEAGRLFAIPTYGFVVAVGATLLWGAFRCFSEGCPKHETSLLELEATSGLTIFLLLRAFSSGATALTGVEAIADGVQAFRRPQARNAATTLAVMGAFSIPMFLGITLLANLLDIRVTEETVGAKSVLAQIGETVFSGSLGFLILQIFTALILILAANTAYQDFPRLSSILARDRYMPSQFRNRGDRLVFSNGIVVLSVLAALLVWAFEANLSRLIQLYVVGVFVALTLSQGGMVRRWFSRRTAGWRWRAALNAVGATTTGAVLVIVLVTRFTRGAWMVVVAVPIVVALFLSVHGHYERIRRVLRARDLRPAGPPPNRFAILVRDLGVATAESVAYLRALRPESVVPLWAGPEDGFAAAAEGWRRIAPRLGELELLHTDGRLRRALRSRLRELRDDPESYVTLVVPERVHGASWWEFVRSRSDLLLKASLLFERGVVVTNVPTVDAPDAVDGARPVEPNRSIVLVPVSGVHDVTVRAVDYATALHASVVEALYFAGDPEEVPEIVRAWSEREMPVRLAVIDSPFRDMGPPLLEEVRTHSTREDTVVTVVLPELVVERWWEQLLHNQTALYIKRLLLFEPRVVVTSVPVQVGAVIDPV